MARSRSDIDARVGELGHRRTTPRGGGALTHEGGERTGSPRARRSRRAARIEKQKGEQLSLAKTGGWGGRRRNAGRKPRAGQRSSVAHAKRPVHKGRHPVHITLRAKPGLPSFRQQLVVRVFTEVLRDQRRRRYKDDFRVIHFSIQSNHLHLIVEADTERAKGRYEPLRSGVSGLEIAFARRLNRMLCRKGKVWADRYHRRDLKTPTETAIGLSYVFNNYTHHGEYSYGEGVLDLYASGLVFDGWEGPHATADPSDRWWRWPVYRAQTWLASRGYLKHGRLRVVPRRP
jgi:REP element-mobilizing transposase RayT